MHSPTPDYMTQTRISVRSTQMPRDMHAMFLRFDANRIAWMADALEEADRPEHARLARLWVEELRLAADRIDEQEAAE